MVTGSQDEKKEWVWRARDVAHPAAAPAAEAHLARRWREAGHAWRAACAAAEQEVAALRAVLAGSGDVQLRRIAEVGLAAIVSGPWDDLTAAMAGLGEAGRGALRRHGGKALVAARALRQHSATDRPIAACDANPYAVPVSIRATLAPALAELEATLECGGVGWHRGPALRHPVAPDATASNACLVAPLTRGQCRMVAAHPRDLPRRRPRRDCFEHYRPT